MLVAKISMIKWEKAMSARKVAFFTRAISIYYKVDYDRLKLSTRVFENK